VVLDVCEPRITLFGFDLLVPDLVTFEGPICSRAVDGPGTVFVCRVDWQGHLRVACGHFGAMAIQGATTQLDRFLSVHRHRPRSQRVSTAGSLRGQAGSLDGERRCSQSVRNLHEHGHFIYFFAGTDDRNAACSPRDGPLVASQRETEMNQPRDPSKPEIEQPGRSKPEIEQPGRSKPEIEQPGQKQPPQPKPQRDGDQERQDDGTSQPSRSDIEHDDRRPGRDAEGWTRAVERFNANRARLTGSGPGSLFYSGNRFLM